MADYYQNLKAYNVTYAKTNTKGETMRDIKLVRELIKREYLSIGEMLKVSNKDGYDDLYGKGMKAGLKLAIDIINGLEIE
jgi:hypothetical protein